MRRYERSLFILAIFSLLSESAFADEVEAVNVPSRAAWIEPVDMQAPWLDLAPQEPVLMTPEIRATGRMVALATDPDGSIYAVDQAAKKLGKVSLPKDTVWVGMDEADHIFAHDGERLWSAQTWEDAQKSEGFVAVLDVPGIRQIDVGSGILVYADASQLNLVDLSTGSIRHLALSDFFDDEKVLAMTPEEVQKAEEAAQKKSKKKKSVSKEKSPESESELVQVSDIQGVWWRSDHTGIIRVRSLLAVRTFVTRDNGRSWELMENAPKDIRHEYGWIWDGSGLVLDQSGKDWIPVCGPQMDIARRWSLGHMSESSALPQENWILLDSPVSRETSVQADESAQANESSSEVSSSSDEANSDSCVSVAMIPVGLSQGVSELWARHDLLYAPQMEDTGMAMGLYRGEMSGDAPLGWMIKPGGELEDMALPSGCDPKYAAAIHGLGILMCQAENAEITLFTRTAASDWVAETILPERFAQDPSLLMAEDGSLSVISACFDETREVPVASSDADVLQGISELPTEMVTKHVCEAAVRLPLDLGQPEIWRLEHIEDVQAFVPLSAGRLITVEGSQQNSSHLTLRTTEKTAPLVEQFDAEPYQGLVMTKEGCLALYDSGVSAQTLREYTSAPQNPDNPDAEAVPSVRLLSTEGRLSELDCSSSRAIAEMGNQPVQLEEKFGDDRYGLRVGAGGFFAVGNVHTWVLRVEGLFPIYRGQYEVGLMYRMAGGNADSALGHIGLLSVRWRYDSLEHFDFAVGAGIGYGTLCGYKKSADKGAMDDDEATEPSAFKDYNHGSMRYLISGIASYKFAEHWKLFISAELIGGMAWGFDLSGGLEVRF